MIVSQFIEKFEELFPENLAYKWDNVGLQVGSMKDKISNILVTLDLNIEVVEEAITKKANFILVHHPIIFSPVKKISMDTYLGKMLEKIIKNNLNVYVAHTNFDLSNHGMNKILADMLKLNDQKLIEMETLDEGLGRYGSISVSKSLWQFIIDIKELFSIESVKLISNERNDYAVKNVAITGGSGSSLLTSDHLNNIDIYITGDVTYHHALDALNAGLTVLDVGHNIEKFGIFAIKKSLENFSSDYGVYLSEVDTNPYKTL